MQNVSICEYMSDATTIPILLDGDTGFGNFNNARRLVNKLEKINIIGNKMRVELVDNIYDTILTADDNDSLFGLKLAPTYQFVLGHKNSSYEVASKHTQNFMIGHIHLQLQSNMQGNKEHFGHRIIIP